MSLQQKQIAREDAEHYLVCPMSLAFRSAGGLTSAVLRECRLAERDFTILSPDYREFRIGRARILPVDQGTSLAEEDLLNRQVICGEWQLLHPQAYLPPALPPEVLQEMYSSAQCEVDSLDKLIAFLAPHMEPGRQKELNLSRRWCRPLAKIPPGSMVHWQEFLLAPAIEMYAESLRQKGCLQTLHLHDSIPQNLHRSEWGVSFLRAISKIDVVFLHTDIYCERLSEQLLDLGLSVPELRRYDLGIDSDHIHRSLAEIDLERPEMTVPGWQSLSAAQREGIREIATTRHTVPHRFICIDRIDPIKGTLVVLRGIESFLGEQLNAGMQLSELQQRFRFFFVHDFCDRAVSCEPNQLQIKYNFLALAELDRLIERFPRVVWSIQALEGDARIAVPALLANCHGISGSIQEGMNLAVQESAYVNTRPQIDSDCTVVLGDNAGFAMQARKGGNLDLAYFPASGSVAEFRRCLKDIVSVQRNECGRLRRNLQELSAKEIECRQSSLLDY